VLFISMAFPLEFHWAWSSFKVIPMTTPSTANDTASTSSPAYLPTDLRSRLMIFGAGSVAALVLAAAGLVVFVMVVNNWNVLNWLE
jgi:hypothetical protein